ncbi:type IV pilus modification protein PilV [Panacagrimonas perspica]|uniref:Type IV pilus modification protein PilV n=1 Tax=Panacagrimonas perspica TaxID=381431 RepID=A0A4S3K116_9GAMM|nr:type IV pilus modification protein PilV [Panacagrimonas perspica]TDU30791.1 type IV pilus modification protein PilV [Panacagrimonas perspica]THD01606.1 type IV pilus modification protein PilV [Panacagrimonas perspica]
MKTFVAQSVEGRGFSLIEVLIAVAVLAIGLLAVAALQIQGVRQNFDSYARSQAVMLANDYIERMYANRPGVLNNDYTGFDSAAVVCGTAPTTICGTQSDVPTPALCDTAALAQYDQYIVACGYAAASAPGGRVGGVQNLLLNGRMRVDCLDATTPGAAVPPPCPAGARYRVVMTWSEQIKNASNRSSVVNPDDNPNDVITQDLALTIQP